MLPTPLIGELLIILGTVFATLGVFLLGYGLGRYAQDKPAFRSETPIEPRPKGSPEDVTDPLYEAFYGGEEEEQPKGIPLEPEGR